MAEHPHHAIEALHREARFARAIARALVGDDLADDVVQDAWLAALERGAATITNPRGWLATVCRNRARDLQRSQRRRDQREAACATSTSAVALDREATLRAVTDALLGLDEPYKSTLISRYFDDLKPREIARRDGVSVATVKSRLQRGLGRLRQRLDGEHRDRRESLLMGLCLLADPSALSAGAATTGALIMSTKAKGILVAVVALLACVISLLVESDVDLGVDAATSTQATAPPEPPSLDTTTIVAESAPEELDRAAVADATPASREVPADATELVVVLTWADGAPAPGIAVKAVPWDCAHSFARKRTRRSDDEGRAVFRDLPPGNSSLYVERGAYGRADLELGISVEVPISIPLGATYDVTVVDEHGRPSPSATVWMSGYGNPTESSAGMRVDDEGRVTLRDVEAHHAVAAYQPGLIPSPSVWLDSDPGVRRPITLRLGGRAARLRGRVIDSARRPVAGATVWVQPTRSDPRSPEEGRPTRKYYRQELRTDGGGWFKADTMPPGPVDIQVRAIGFAPAHREVEMTAERGADEVIELGRGATLVGTVVDADGAPIPKAQVCIGKYATLEASLTRTAADGMYRLTDIPPGEVTVHASQHDHGKSETTLILLAESEARWDAVLDPGNTLRGIVLDERDQPCAGRLVFAMEAGKPRHRGWSSSGVWTDPAGRFCVRNLPDARCDVYVHGENQSLPEITVTDVDADAGELTVRIRDEARQTAYIHGVVLDSAGEPHRVSVTVRADDRDLYMVYSAETDGAFRLGPLSPGTYTVTVYDEAVGWMTVGDFDLAADQTVDAGVVRLRQPGLLSVDVTPVEGVNLQWVECLARTATDTWDASYHPRNERGLRGGPFPITFELAPGTYEVELSGGGMITQTSTVEVIANRTTPLLVTPERSFGALVLVDELGVPAERARFTIIGSDGLTVAEQEVVDRAADITLDHPPAGHVAPDGGYLHFVAGLPAGQYRARVVSDDGRTGEGDIVLGPSAPHEASWCLVELH